jgi:uncharacterized protein with HEPN domain
MRRDPRAFLLDVLDAADATMQDIDGISLDDYGNSRLIRSAVDKLTHEYIKVDNTLVWGVIEAYLPSLREACARLIGPRQT